MKPKDVRVLRVNCDHSEGGKWRVHLLEEEWKALSESYDRIFQDRYDLLTVHTKEGMLASEWLMRTATAERERDEARAELAFVQAEYAAANESDLTRDALCLQLAALKHELRMATERAAIAGRERDEAVALNQAMNRLRAHGSAKRCACQWEEGDSPCPVHGEEER